MRNLITSLVLGLFIALPLSAAPEDHVIGGIPESSERIQVVEWSGFLAGFNPATRNPAWVAYRLSGAPGHEAGKRPSKFFDDPNVRGEAQHEDYTRSGYDRGHLASNAVIASYFGNQAQVESFYMTNIIPQSPKLNRGGVWREIETLELSMGAAFGEVWVITGPIEVDRSNVMASGVSIPEGSFKVILDKRESTGAYRAIAFVLPQDPPSGHIGSYSVSVDRVEELTGLDFFPDFPSSFESVEKSPASSIWIKVAGAYGSYSAPATARTTAASSSNASVRTPTTSPKATIRTPESGGTYWISGTGKTHKRGCRYYGSGNGSYGPASGVNCKICGGAN